MGSEEDELSFGQRMSKRWGGFKHFLWNGERKEFLGRGGMSWAKISLFYLVFYTCLAAFWASMLLVFMQTVSYDRPKWISYVSTPGLAVTPSLYEERISYTPSNKNTFNTITSRLDTIWKSLSDDNQEHTETCTPVTVVGNKTEQRYCSFSRNQLGQWCTQENIYGYNTTEPCIFINMNRVWGWIPEDPEDLASEEIPDGFEEGYVHISCDAYKEKDRSSINSTTVYPPQGLPFAYFPYVTGANKKKQAMYISPYVAVRISFNEAEAVGKDVKIRCEAYTGNIDPKKGLFDNDERSEFTILFNLGKQEAAKDEM